MLLEDLPQESLSMGKSLIMRDTLLSKMDFNIKIDLKRTLLDTFKSANRVVNICGLRYHIDVHFIQRQHPESFFGSTDFDQIWDRKRQVNFPKIHRLDILQNNLLQEYFIDRQRDSFEVMIFWFLRGGPLQRPATG